MKTHNILKTIIAIAMVCIPIIWSSGTSLAAPTRGYTILIVPRPAPEDEPRTPIQSPFIAELMDGNCYVLLEATDSCGTVPVQITSTAGDNYSTYFDTSVEEIFLPISGNAGYYTLTIITPGGTHYVGEFTI